MKIYTGELLENVEKRNFKVYYDETLPELFEIVKEKFLADERDDDYKKIVKNLVKKYNEIQVVDNLKEELQNQKEDVFYYVSTNNFIIDYYKNNPNTEWKIQAVLQVGFPFQYITQREDRALTFAEEELIKMLKKQKWSIFVFTKKQISEVTIGFDDRNTYSVQSLEESKLFDYTQERIKEFPEEKRGSLILVWDNDNDDQDYIITKYLETGKIPLFTDAEYQQYNYSFTVVPVENFRIDYLDYISRYKKSVVDVFGYPDENEKIKKLKDVVEFVNIPHKKQVYPSYEARKQNVLIGDFYFQNLHLKPTVRIGYQDYELFDQYEIHSYLKNISPYYLYCLLSSEFIIDYYSERYSIDGYDEYGSALPLEDCIYIEMSPEKMQNSKYADIYERDINPRLKARDMISSVQFATSDAQKTIEKYLVEIKNNIDSGSYYSATIVMGSVLEAFLIDWLSEIDGKDYFKEDYLVTDQKYHYSKRADLIDYINIIQKKRPNWIEGADKATEIRKKRNLVHARLYIEEGEITQDVCYEMLNNLETIINNRWKK